MSSAIAGAPAKADKIEAFVKPTDGIDFAGVNSDNGSVTITLVVAADVPEPGRSLCLGSAPLFFGWFDDGDPERG